MRAKRLGRGLGNLLNRTDGEPVAPAAREAVAPAAADADPARGNGNGHGRGESSEEGAIRLLPIEGVRPNPFQPRTAFHEAGLEELEASIREYGVLQPIVVRPAASGYEVIAGERRLRASRNLGMERVPALVRAASDEDMQTLALVENLQREDLNAMEKSRALKAMMRNFDLTQEGVAERVGKARTTIANLLRLLDLPAEVQAFVEDGRLTGAHARAVLQVEGPSRRLLLARQAVEQGWSVREVERRARLGPTVGKRKVRVEDPYVRDLQDRLRRVLATDVRLLAKGKGGRIEIRYHDADELDRLLELLKA